MATTRFQPTDCWLHAFAETCCPCHSLLIVEDTGNVVGWCRIFPELASTVPRAELGVGLLSPYRNQGIGSALVLQSLRMTRDIGYGRVWLTTHPGNTRAIRVFSRCGFVFVRAVREDLNEMVCELQDPIDR